MKSVLKRRNVRLLVETVLFTLAFWSLAVWLQIALSAVASVALEMAYAHWQRARLKSLLEGDGFDRMLMTQTQPEEN